MSSSVQAGSTDSSSSGYGAINFTTPEAQAEFTRLMGKSTTKERGFLPSPDDGKLVEMIQSRGWESFCEAPAAVPLSIVREFYANAKAEQNGFSVVRGLTVDYTLETIRRVIGGKEMRPTQDDWVRKNKRNMDLDRIIYYLCMPNTEWRRNPSTNERLSFPASAMNRYARAWNLFICANIMPSTHTHEVTVDRAILLFGILTDEYVDIAYVIHQNILRFLRGSTTGAIPHATLVTKLCTAVGVRWSAEEQLQMPSSVIDHAAIERLPEWDGGRAHPKGLGYFVDDSEGGLHRAPRGPSDTAGPSRQSGGHSGLSDAQYRRLTRRMDTMHNIHRQFAQDLTQALDTAFRATGVDIEWPVFGAGMPYPPPDSPPDSPPDEGEESDRSDSS